MKVSHLILAFVLLISAVNSVFAECKFANPKYCDPKKFDTVMAPVTPPDQDPTAVMPTTVPIVPGPSPQISSRCGTPYGACPIPGGGPIGAGCYCQSPYGPIGGQLY